MAKLGIKELATLLADKRNLDIADATHFVEALFDVLSMGLHYEKVVKIKGLGTFKVIAVSARKSVDVNTGEAIELSGRDKITFTPDATLRDLVNRPFAQFETVVVNDGVDFSAIDAKMEDTPEAPTEVAAPVASEAAQPVAVSEVEVSASARPIAESTVAAEAPANEAPEPAPEVTLSAVVTPELPGTSEAIEDSTGTAVADYEPATAVTEDAPATPEPTKVRPEPAAPTQSVAEEPTAQTAPEQEQSAKPTPQPMAKSATTVSWQDQMMESQTKTLTETNELLREQLEHSQRLMRIFGIVLVAFVVLCCCGGYYMFSQFTQRDNRIEHLETQILLAKQAKTIKPKPAPRAASEAIIPTVPDEVPQDAAPEAKATAATPTTAKVTEKAAPAKPAENKKIERTAMAQYESDPRVRTGAYIIIGVKTTVKAKPGQSLASISRLFLGPGMECYVEAVNGVTEVKAGQTVKIPELKLKRR